MQNARFESVNTAATLRTSSTIVQPNSVMAAEDGFFYGTDGDDVLSTVPQYPHLDGRGGNDTLTGDERDNTLRGGAGLDQLFGQDGNDILDGGTSQDRMEGGTGNDTYYADRGDIIIEQADGGNDTVIIDPFGGSYQMPLHVEELVLTGTGWRGGFGNGEDNTIIGTDNENLLYGYGGNDTIYGNGGTDRIYGDDINAPYAGNDVLYGGDGNDFLYGGQGDDILYGGAGVDMLSGSGGNDTAVYEDVQAAVYIDLTRPFNNAGGAAGEYLFSIENLVGTAFNDTLFGGQSRNTLDGGQGEDQLYGRNGGDTLRGGGGNDFLDGGAHRDVLTGGEGADTFYFASAAEAGDIITDFTAGDHIALSGSGFGLENIDDLAFALTTDPLTEMPTLIYHAGSGNLSWDADGSGAEAAVYFATLTGAPTLTQNDFLIV